MRRITRRKLFQQAGAFTAVSVLCGCSLDDTQTVSERKRQNGL
jgi:hypothetical protein